MKKLQIIALLVLVLVLGIIYLVTKSGNSSPSTPAGEDGITLHN